MISNKFGDASLAWSYEMIALQLNLEAENKGLASSSRLPRWCFFMFNLCSSLKGMIQFDEYFRDR